MTKTPFAEATTGTAPETTLPPKVPGEPAPDEDKCELPDTLVGPDGDTTNQPAFDKEQLRRIPAD